jgi:hypothetical protein
MHRALYRKDKIYLNCLLEIATKCNDTQITHFLNNLDDLKELLQSFNKNVFKFLDGAFSQNNQTMKIK